MLVFQVTVIALMLVVLLDHPTDHHKMKALLVQMMRNEKALFALESHRSRKDAGSK